MTDPSVNTANTSLRNDSSIFIHTHQSASVALFSPPDMKQLCVSHQCYDCTENHSLCRIAVTVKPKPEWFFVVVFFVVFFVPRRLTQNLHRGSSVPNYRHGSEEGNWWSLLCVKRVIVARKWREMSEVLPVKRPLFGAKVKSDMAPFLSAVLVVHIFSQENDYK